MLVQSGDGSVVVSNLNDDTTTKVINHMIVSLKMCKSSERVRRFRRKIFKNIFVAVKKIPDSKERLYFQRFFNNNAFVEGKKKQKNKFFKPHLSDEDQVIQSQIKNPEFIDWEHLIELNRDFLYIYRYLKINHRYVNSFIYITFIHDISWNI